MSQRRSLLLMMVAIFTAYFGISCSAKQTEPAAAPDTRSADEAAIRAADADWAKAAAAKDLEKCMSYYADDAVLFSPGVPAVVGKDNVRKFMQQLLGVPNMQLNIIVSSVDVARSGDLAFDRGSVQVATVGKNGKPATNTSQYALTWKKSTDGSWKIAADTSASDK